MGSLAARSLRIAKLSSVLPLSTDDLQPPALLQLLKAIEHAGQSRLPLNVEKVS